MTSLVAAEVDGERLTDDEIISFFGLLMIAGNDTTRQSTSHGMKAITDNPEQRAWLMEDLAGRMPIAVEEIVRWATPIMTFRRTARECELAGQQVTEGDKVIMFYASANWDTAVFDHPERFDLSRSPNKHVSFGGGGIHHCLGNQLARRQLAATFRELLTRLPDIHVVAEPHYGHRQLLPRGQLDDRAVHAGGVTVMKGVVDRNRCSSIGMCEAVAPDVFEVGADGALAILDDSPADSRRAEMEQACMDCPTQALSIDG